MRTHITDNLGSKEAETKISKIVHSANIREIRKHDFGDNFNKNYCGECGFRIRGKNHLDGKHHKGITIPCHRGR